MRTSLLALAAFSAVLPAAASAQKAPAAVVVVVDTDRIYRECAACVPAFNQLTGVIDSARARTKELGTPLETEGLAIEQAGAALKNLTGAARTSAETALNKRVQTFQASQTQAQMEVATLEQNIKSIQAHLVQQVGAKLDPAISQVMTARGANLAVDTKSTLAHAGGIDVTADVLTALNGALSSLNVTPLPAAPAPQ